jgi:hypothetical protein
MGPVDDPIAQLARRRALGGRDIQDEVFLAGADVKGVQREGSGGLVDHSGDPIMDRSARLAHHKIIDPSEVPYDATGVHRGQEVYQDDFAPSGYGRAQELDYKPWDPEGRRPLSPPIRWSDEYRTYHTLTPAEQRKVVELAGLTDDPGFVQDHEVLPNLGTALSNPESARYLLSAYLSRQMGKEGGGLEPGLFQRYTQDPQESLPAALGAKENPTWARRATGHHVTGERPYLQPADPKAVGPLEALNTGLPVQRVGMSETPNTDRPGEYGVGTAVEAIVRKHLSENGEEGLGTAFPAVQELWSSLPRSVQLSIAGRMGLKTRDLFGRPSLEPSGIQDIRDFINPYAAKDYAPGDVKNTGDVFVDDVVPESGNLDEMYPVPSDEYSDTARRMTESDAYLMADAPFTPEPVDVPVETGRVLKSNKPQKYFKSDSFPDTSREMAERKNDISGSATSQAQFEQQLYHSPEMRASIENDPRWGSVQAFLDDMLKMGVPAAMAPLFLQQMLGDKARPHPRDDRYLQGQPHGDYARMLLGRA